MENTYNFQDRNPAVAGKFYPNDPAKLEAELNSLFSSATPRQCNFTKAIISPHAGYVYSGIIAASAFNQIDPSNNFKRVFILASSHYESFNGAAVYCNGNFLMPYGEEKVDMDFGKMLLDDHPDVFIESNSAHEKEHSIEVQLPFLHHVLKSGYHIVPIVIGTNDPKVCKHIASALRPYFDDGNLFVISSDFSHYPSGSEACTIDKTTMQAIVGNDPRKLMDTLSANSTAHISNLYTSLCGWTSVLTLVYMTAFNSSIEYKPIRYSNSGDVKYYGEPDRVVGYWAIAVTSSNSKESGFHLSNSDKEILMEISRKTLEGCCRHEKSFSMDTSGFSDTLKTECGAFVSLHKHGKLRGCIGRLVANMPLYKMIHEMTISAALHDPRFTPVNNEELADIDIEISVLSPLKKINDIDEIELGKHGIYISKGHHNGVFLPQVATETGWTKEEFLGYCSSEKAGLEWDGWKEADIFIFTATVF